MNIPYFADEDILSALREGVEEGLLVANHINADIKATRLEEVGMILRRPGTIRSLGTPFGLGFVAAFGPIMWFEQAEYVTETFRYPDRVEERSVLVRPANGAIFTAAAPDCDQEFLTPEQLSW